jgi:hypothetical protein
LSEGNVHSLQIDFGVFGRERNADDEIGRDAIAFRIDIWDDTGNSIVEQVAGVDDFEVAEATYRALPRRDGQRRALPCDRPRARGA